MKKIFSYVATLCVGLSLMSWGFKGHRAVATIAQKHLTNNTAHVVSAYLKGESMTDVSTWADENRSRSTASWHFLNLPLGLNHEQFVKIVSQSEKNVYTAIMMVESQLRDKNSSIEQKNEALKYLIHLVGDAHQPMHISRKEDKGGNKIQVRFDDRGTNLHSLWDSKLIDHEGFSEEDIARNYDTASPEEIKKWQNESPMEWIWESYQISSRLYTEVKPGQGIDDAHYKKYIIIIHRRIDQAGVRLAGELNKLFNNETAPVIQAGRMVQAGTNGTIVKLENLNNAIGMTVTVEGKVFSVKVNRSMVLANMGAAYPNQLLTLVFKGEAKSLGETLDGKTINVRGKVVNYRGKPEIIVTSASQVKQ